MMESNGRNNWYEIARARAGERFAALGWPSATEEEWRRSDLSRLGLEAFLGREARGGVSFGSELDAEARAAGVRLAPLAEAGLPGLEAGRPGARAAFERALETGDRFAAWNLAEGEAWVLELPSGVNLARPLLVDCRLQGPVGLPRLAVVAGEGARADVILRVSLASSSVPALANLALDVEAGAGSVLRIYELRESGEEALWFAEARARLGRDASFVHLVASDSGRFVKSRVDCSLEGPGADAALDGLFRARRGRHLDLRTVQRHLAPRATSRALYKGALDEGGRSVFQGLIEVAPGAFGTDAFLANRNLLLGDGARADSLPTLRIANNDVRCSHGSTTGKLPEAELFYLESRGFDRGTARELLVQGFFTELLERLPADFSEPLAERLSAEFPSRAA